MNNETLTKAICNKGFSGNSSILPRIKFRVGGQVSSPQSLTAYSLYRYRQVYGQRPTKWRPEPTIKKRGGSPKAIRVRINYI